MPGPVDPNGHPLPYTSGAAFALDSLGVSFPIRPRIRFGAGFTITDDETGRATELAISSNRGGVVDAVAAMRAYPGSVGNGATMSGYATAVDNAGGVFVWSNTAAVDDGGTILNPGGLGASQAGWRRVFTDALNVRWFGATGDGVTNDTAAFQLAVDAAAARELAVYVPSGKYRLEIRYPVSGLATGVGAAVVVPDGVSIYGDGYRSEIHDPTPFSVANVEYEDLPLGYGYHRMFQLTGSNNEIYGLRFSGLNGDVDGVGYTPGEQFQNAAIATTGYSQTDPVGIAALHYDINIHDCTFENLYGFIVQDLTGIGSTVSMRINVRNNIARYCANGINTATYYSDISGNNLWCAEGLELGGDFITVSKNIMGGEYVIGIVVYGDGNVVDGNVIDGTLLPGTLGSIGEHCTIMAVGCADCVISNNTVLNTPEMGIGVFADTFGYTLHGLRRASSVALTNNRVTNVRTVGQGACKMIHLNACDDVTVVGGGVRSTDTGALYAGDIGIYMVDVNRCAIDGVTVFGCRYAGIITETGTNCQRLSITNCKLDYMFSTGINIKDGDSILLSNNFVNGSVANIVVTNVCTNVRLLSNDAGDYVVIDPTGVKYEAGNSWQDV